MGRSLSSCFKIIYCAGESANDDDGSPPPESKTSPGKRTWSFQKRSVKHNVSSSHVISESVSTANDKEDVGALPSTVNSEKASVSQKATVDYQTNESPVLPFVGVPSLNPEQFTNKATDKVDFNIEEDVVVIVQASIRGYLAKRELEKIRNIVKLQAAIRRYLVRKQAVGTLRCIQAIFKLQQIVRARLSIQSKELTSKEKLSEKTTAEMEKCFEIKPSKTRLAIRKMASNSFASQLLKSTLETKSVRIYCNPLGADSGWMWLERWNALTSPDRHDIISNQDVLDEDVNNDLNAHDVDNKFQLTPENMSSDPNFVPCDSTTIQSEVVEDSITNSSENIELEVPSSLQGQISNSPVQNHHMKGHDDETWLKENPESIHSQISLKSEPVSNVELDSQPDYSIDADKNSTPKEAHETQEMEVGQAVIDSRKSKNPGFAAVQAKFEELSAASSSNKSLSNASRDTRSDSKSAHLGSKVEEEGETKSDYLNIGDIRKEINTTSLPERSESELSDNTSENRAYKENTLTSRSSTTFNIGDMKVEPTDLSCDSNAIRSTNAARSVNAAAPIQVDQKSEDSITLNTQVLSSKKSPKVNRSSQGSPISHITVPESNGTPSSLSSIHPKSTKAEYITPIRQKRSQIVINNSPTDSNNDSSEKTSSEHLKKDTKSSKRRNSFSMVKTDHEHQTISSNLLPSYMKPTESAMAKVSTGISQKSSPDLFEKDTHIKKRNSLPNGDGKQGSSPRMQRSISQVQQNTKGNGIHSPQNSAEKRWLR